MAYYKRFQLSRKNEKEVKSGKNYTLGSLSKCCEKYEQYIDVPYVLHSKDVKVENGVTYLRPS